MAYEHILYEKKARVAYVTINRPDSLNSLHPPASMEIRDAFTDFRDDREMLVAIITGAGDRAFCAGDDLKYVAEHALPGEPYPGWEECPFAGITSDFTCWKPIIAAVNGYTLGGGLELALACDIIVAAEHAEFGLPEPKVGVVAVAGGAVRLSRQLPFKVAMGMLLTGRRLSAQQAYGYGLVNEIAPRDRLMATAEQWASDIVEGAPLAVRASKQMALTGLDRPLDEAIGMDYPEYRKALHSPDYLEGPRAFAEKRRPRWDGD